MSNRLFVAWRSEDPQTHSVGWGPVGVLERTASGIYRFVYTKGAQTLDGFKPFPGMPDLNLVYESDDLFPIFANRLMNSRRPEYRPSLVWSGFNPDQPPDPIALLGVTEGLRQTDALEVFPCPEPDGNRCFVARFFVHGLRHSSPDAIERVMTLRHGDQLRIVPEPSNQHDRFAVAIWTNGVEQRIGYVPRYLARDIGWLYRTCGPDAAHLTVERVNPSAPMQRRVLCRMNACWPDEFEPCSDEAFQPIVSNTLTH